MLETAFRDALPRCPACSSDRGKLEIVHIVLRVDRRSKIPTHLGKIGLQDGVVWRLFIAADFHRGGGRPLEGPTAYQLSKLPFGVWSRTCHLAGLSGLLVGDLCRYRDSYVIPAKGERWDPTNEAGRLRIRNAQLFFKQVFEGLAGVAGARGRRRDGTGGLGVRSRSGVFFDRHAKFVEGAVVLGVFGGDTLANGLRAFELRASVEKSALLAAMELELTLGTFAVGIKTWSENGATIGTAGASDGSDHARGARAELIGAAGSAGWRLLFVRALALLTLFRIAVTAMTILAIHKRLRPPVLAGLQRLQLNFKAIVCQLACVHSGCYTRPDRAMPT